MTETVDNPLGLCDAPCKLVVAGMCWCTCQSAPDQALYGWSGMADEARRHTRHHELAHLTDVLIGSDHEMRDSTSRQKPRHSRFRLFACCGDQHQLVVVVARLGPMEQPPLTALLGFRHSDAAGHRS